MHFSCYGENTEEHAAAVTKTLLRAGSNAHSRDSRGNTPYLIACSAGRVDLLRLLREVGADPTVVNDQGQSAYDVAMFFNHPTVAALVNHESPSHRYRQH